MIVTLFSRKKFSFSKTLAMLCHAAYGKSNMHTQVLGKDCYLRLKTT